MALKGKIDGEDIDVEHIKESVGANLTNEKVFSFLEESYVV